MLLLDFPIFCHHRQESFLELIALLVDLLDDFGLDLPIVTHVSTSLSVIEAFVRCRSA